LRNGNSEGRPSITSRTTRRDGFHPPGRSWYALILAKRELSSPSYKELGYASSRIQVVEIGDRGQIQNWPAGFMDDDIRESRRLLDVMYGTPDDADDDEEAAP
jgi:hypothetical protein